MATKGKKPAPRLVVDYPNPVLKNPVSTEPVTEEQAKKHFKVMKNALKSRQDGVALAANQADIDAAMFVYYRDHEEQADLVGVLNPVILEKSDEMLTSPEGCLSLFAWRDKVPRHAWVKVFYTEYPSMDDVMRTVEGYEARIFQHETDHLLGRTILDVPSQSS